MYLREAIVAKFRLQLMVAVCCAAGIVLLGAVLLRGIAGASDLIVKRQASEHASIAAYILWHKTWLAESSPFRADGGSSLLRAISERRLAEALHRDDPCSRPAFVHEWESGALPAQQEKWGQSNFSVSRIAYQNATEKLL